MINKSTFLKIISAFFIIVFLLSIKSYLHTEMKYSGWQLSDILSRTPQNHYKANVAEIENALPDIEKSNHKPTLDVKPSSKYLESIEYAKNFGAENPYSVEELLYFDDYKEALNKIDIELTESRKHKYSSKLIQNKSIVAAYFARHGDCNTALSHYDFLLKNDPILLKIFWGDALYPYDLNFGKSFFISNVASTAMLCKTKKEAIKIVEGYIVHAVPTDRTKQADFDDKQKVLRASIYSNIGANLYRAGFQKEGLSIINTAINKTEKNNRVAHVFIIKNLISAHMPQVAVELYAHDQTVWTTNIGILANEFARQGQLDKIFETYKLISKDRNHSVPASSFRILVEKSKNEKNANDVLADLDKINTQLKNLQLSGTNTALAFLTLAQEYKKMGNTQKASDILNDVLEENKIEHHVFGNTEALIRTQIIIDRNVNRAFQTYKKHVTNPKNYSDWGYFLAATEKFAPPQNCKMKYTVKKIKE